MNTGKTKKAKKASEKPRARDATDVFRARGQLLLTLSGGLTIFQAAERKPELLHA
jgi:hypothetical protein